MAIFRNLLTTVVLATAFGGDAFAQTCAAPSSWTDHATVPVPDNNTEPASNCDFHIWSWNTFLWMTQAKDGGLRFEDFYGLDTLKALPGEESLESKLLVLTVRSGKARGGQEVDGLNSILQAGSHGVLVNAAKPGGASGHVTYFSQAVNDTFYNFVKDQGYYDQATYLAADPSTNFPNGAMEFKFSWKIVSDGEDTSTFFTAPAKVAKLVSDPKTGKVVASPSETIDATVALVGVHVVGVVQNHPEFVWATFEHIGNAPDLPAGMGTASTKAVSDQDFTFYAANTPANESNIPNSGLVSFDGDPENQLLQPVVNVFRQFAWGSDDSSDGRANAADIQSLNASVAKTALSNSPVWSNYQLIGAVWGPPNTLIPNQQVTGFGSTKLSNATLETFTQPAQNCFSCHTTFPMKPGQPGMNMNVSHIFSELFAN